MTSQEKRIEYLFSDKTRKKPNPIAVVAIIFAERRGQWLTHSDVLKLVKKRFADSTVLKRPYEQIILWLSQITDCQFAEDKNLIYCFSTSIHETHPDISWFYRLYHHHCWIDRCQYANKHIRTSKRCNLNKVRI